MVTNSAPYASGAPVFVPRAAQNSLYARARKTPTKRKFRCLYTAAFLHGSRTIVLTTAWFRKKKTTKEDDRNGRSFVNTLHAITEKVVPHVDNKRLIDMACT